MITFFPHEIKSYLEKNFPPVIPIPSHLSISLNIKENLDCLRSRPRKKEKTNHGRCVISQQENAETDFQQIYLLLFFFLIKPKKTTASTETLPLQGRKVHSFTNPKIWLLFFRGH